MKEDEERRERGREQANDEGKRGRGRGRRRNGSRRGREKEERKKKYLMFGIFGDIGFERQDGLTQITFLKQT